MPFGNIKKFIKTKLQKEIEDVRKNTSQADFDALIDHPWAKTKITNKKEIDLGNPKNDKRIVSEEDGAEGDGTGGKKKYVAPIRHHEDPGTTYENVLHQFTSYNTIFTLSGLSEEELNHHTYLYNSPHEVIARTGGIGDPNVRDEKYAEQVELLREKATDGPRTFREKKRNPGTDYDESKFFLDAGRDIFFENVNILSTTGPNAERGLSNFQRMEFELHEPFGISFVEKMRAAAFINGYLDFHSAPYLLTIQWKGWNDRGGSPKNQALTRKIPIRIVRVEFDVDAGGAKYTCVAVAAESIAFDDRFKYPRRQININASNWWKWKESIETQLNEQMVKEKEENLRQLSDQYIFELSPEVLKDAEEMGIAGNSIHQSADAPKTEYQRNLKILNTYEGGWNRGAATGVMTEEQRKAYIYIRTHERDQVPNYYGWAITDGTDPTKVGASPTIMSSKPSKFETTDAVVDSHTSLVKIFEDAVRTGLGYADITNGFWYELGRKLLNDGSINPLSRNVEDGKELRITESEKVAINKIADYFNSDQFSIDLKKEENQYIDWFMIKPKFEVLPGYDNIRKCQPKKITFTAVPTKIHILKFIKPGVSFGNIDWSQYVRKKYNYIYTGKNIDVQNLKIHYKTAYYQRNLRPFNEDEKSAGIITGWREDFESRINEVFGQERTPEPLAPLTYEPSVIHGKSTLNTQDPRARKNQQFYDYLTNPQVDMIRIELEILGDPAFICQDQFTPLGPGVKIKFGNQRAWNPEYESFNAEGYQPLIMLNYRLPEDFNDKTGEYFSDAGKNQTMWFSGVYQVNRVESRIDQGSFTQVLHCSRLNNQKGKGISATNSKLYKYMTKIEKDAEEKAESAAKLAEKKKVALKRGGSPNYIYTGKNGTRDYLEAIKDEWF